MNPDMPESNDGSVADHLAKVAAHLKALGENSPTEEEIREFMLNRNPFEDIARILSQATEITVALDKNLAGNLTLHEQIELADTKALIERRKKLLLKDWKAQLDETFPGSN